MVQEAEEPLCADDDPGGCVSCTQPAHARLEGMRRGWTATGEAQGPGPRRSLANLTSAFQEALERN